VPKRDKITAELMTLHDEKLYSSPDIFLVIKSRRMKWESQWNLWGKGETRMGFW
jgi:hypothetical protein